MSLVDTNEDNDDTNDGDNVDGTAISHRNRGVCVCSGRTKDTDQCRLAPRYGCLTPTWRFLRCVRLDD